MHCNVNRLVLLNFEEQNVVYFSCLWFCYSVLVTDQPAGCSGLKHFIVVLVVPTIALFFFNLSFSTRSPTIVLIFDFLVDFVSKLFANKTEFLWFNNDANT